MQKIKKKERLFESVIKSTFVKKNGYKYQIAKIIAWFQSEYNVNFNWEEDTIIYGIERFTKPKTHVIYAGFKFLPFKEFVEKIESLGWEWIEGNFEDIIRSRKNGKFNKRN